MRWLPKSIPYLVVAIAVYFTAHFGIEAVRIFTSPVYGLDQTGFGQVVHGIGSRFGLGAIGLMRVAAFLGTIKFAIAVLFAIYLCSRMKSWLGHETNHEIVDAAAVLIVAVTVVAATPAVLDGATDALAQYRLPLWLAGLAVTLSMIERVVAEEEAQLRADAARRKRIPIHDVTLPPKRNRVSTLRWDALRRSVNLHAA